MRYVLFINITDGYTFSCDGFVGITSNQAIADVWAHATAGDTFYMEIPDGDFLVDDIDAQAKNNMLHDSLVPKDFMNLPEAVKFIKELMANDNKTIQV